MSKSLVILGAGYTARFVVPLGERRYDTILATSRDPDRRLSRVASDCCLRFDLMDRSTWKLIPMNTDLLWCFPAVPPDLVREFATSLNPSSRRIVVLGSTSAYRLDPSHGYPPPWIDETAPINLNSPRVQGEEFLRTTCGAIVLRVAGIYGPGRNPIDWIRTGRVRSSRKYVNLIHVGDLALTCLAALEEGQPGETYNVSDGTPNTWEQICVLVRERWGVHAAPARDDAAAGKRIRNRKLLSLIESAARVLSHSNFVEALDQIQSGTLRPEAAP